MLDRRANAASRPMSVLSISEITDSNTVSSQPCQNAFRYFQTAPQLDVAEASKAQQHRDKAKKRNPAVAILAHKGAGERGLSRKLVSELLTRLPNNSVTDPSIRLSLSLSSEQILRPTCFPSISYLLSSSGAPTAESFPPRL
jgi:hypothetical protein